MNTASPKMSAEIALAYICEDIDFGVDANGVMHVPGPNGRLYSHQVREPGPGWQSIAVQNITAWWHQGLSVLVYQPPVREDGRVVSHHGNRWMWRVVPQIEPAERRRPAGGDYTTSAEAMQAAEECGTDEWAPQPPLNATIAPSRRRAA